MEKQNPIIPATIQAHKNQLFSQILIPFLLMAALILAGAIFIISGAEAQLGIWSDVSVIWLLAPTLFFALALLVILITTIYGMVKLLQILPRYTGRTQEIFAMLSAGTLKIADGASKPIIWIRQIGALMKSIVRR
jgi:hypothetical protein